MAAAATEPKEVVLLLSWQQDKKQQLENDRNRLEKLKSLLDRPPHFKEWSQQELQLFHEAIGQFGKSGSGVELEMISKHVGSNRSMLDIKLQYQKYMKMVRQSIEETERINPWTTEEHKLFEKLLLEHYEDPDKFQKIAEKMTSRSIEEITQHYHKLSYDIVHILTRPLSQPLRFDTEPPAPTKETPPPRLPVLLQKSLSTSSFGSYHPIMPNGQPNAMPSVPITSPNASFSSVPAFPQNPSNVTTSPFPSPSFSSSSSSSSSSLSTSSGSALNQRPIMPARTPIIQPLFSMRTSASMIPIQGGAQIIHHIPANGRAWQFYPPSHANANPAGLPLSTNPNVQHALPNKGARSSQQPQHHQPIAPDPNSSSLDKSRSTGSVPIFVTENVGAPPAPEKPKKRATHQRRASHSVATNKQVAPNPAHAIPMYDNAAGWVFSTDPHSVQNQANNRVRFVPNFVPAPSYPPQGHSHPPQHQVFYHPHPHPHPQQHIQPAQSQQPVPQNYISHSRPMIRDSLEMSENVPMDDAYSSVEMDTYQNGSDSPQRPTYSSAPSNGQGSGNYLPDQNENGYHEYYPQEHSQEQYTQQQMSQYQQYYQQVQQQQQQQEFHNQGHDLQHHQPQLQQQIQSKPASQAQYRQNGGPVIILSRLVPNTSQTQNIRMEYSYSSDADYDPNVPHSTSGPMEGTGDSPSFSHIAKTLHFSTQHLPSQGAALIDSKTHESLYATGDERVDDLEDGSASQNGQYHQEEYQDTQDHQDQDQDQDQHFHQGHQGHRAAYDDSEMLTSDQDSFPQGPVFGNSTDVHNSHNETNSLNLSANNNNSSHFDDFFDYQ